MKLHSPEIIKVYIVLVEEFKKYQMPIVDLIQIQTRDPIKVLIATILSARTRDETTAAAAKRLFEKVTNINDFNNYSVTEIEKLIYPVGFFHEKAKNLKQLPSFLQENFHGQIPQTVEELI